ncbi:MAG TPA: FxsA family protein [Afifellaceae bacterium]|nr:FxsA family protein [Afifellaceae bacterium]
MTLVTAIIGTMLLRRQGLAIIQQIRQELEANRIPAGQLADGAMIAVAGILLLTPGFVTDSVGFALFVPALRALIWRQIGKHLDVTVSTAAGPGQNKRNIVELDETEYSADADPNSPWRTGKK